MNAQLVRMSDDVAVREPELACECGDPACRERTPISAEGYALLVEQGRPLLAPAHTGETDLARMTIEQAKGVLIERFGMAPDEAFHVLRRSARSQRRPLAEVCRELVATAGGRTP